MRGRRIHAPLCGTCVVLALVGAVWPLAVQGQLPVTSKIQLGLGSRLAARAIDRTHVDGQDLGTSESIGLPVVLNVGYGVDPVVVGLEGMFAGAPAAEIGAYLEFVGGAEEILFLARGSLGAGVEAHDWQSVMTHESELEEKYFWLRFGIGGHFFAADWVSIDPLLSLGWHTGRIDQKGNRYQFATTDGIELLFSMGLSLWFGGESAQPIGEKGPEPQAVITRVGDTRVRLRATAGDPMVTLSVQHKRTSNWRGCDELVLLAGTQKLAVDQVDHSYERVGESLTGVVSRHWLRPLLDRQRITLRICDQHLDLESRHLRALRSMFSTR